MKRALFFLFLIYTSSMYCQQIQPTDYLLIDKRAEVTFGYRVAHNRLIDIVVLHSTYSLGKDSFDIQTVLAQFKKYGVCAHYIIGRGGEIYYAVNEKHVAYHAGRSVLPGTTRTNLNTNSIGIEIINTKTTPPSNQQYQALRFLIKELQQRHPIKYIVRHSDIAPGRKTDPWLFEWEGF